ncbi:hypothetical protein GG804_25655 [Sphingomonas histidinilytica]|uniref:hypothetical protein n=1 Tax=Rhizorhabdus histidinilytica TaxID=439228 RepID=UPI001ADD1BEA|nr:hypothetical protein [Rhizorhabdus histidinilytica]MBO9380158.1 hypothetical protein [Rhizorhabdus histidinilytica]
MIAAFWASTGASQQIWPYVEPETTKQKTDAAIEKWIACLGSAADRYTAIVNDPDTIVTATFGECGEAESAYKAAVAASFTGILPADDRPRKADEIARGMRPHLREVLFARILNRRLKAR